VGCVPLGDRDLARYQQAFPEMANDHRQALQGSLQLHLKLATARQSEGDYGDAYREFLLAGLRKPSDSALRERAMQAWTSIRGGTPWTCKQNGPSSAPAAEHRRSRSLLRRPE